MKKILIVSHLKDVHATYVAEKARARGLEVFIFDTGLYPKKNQLSLNLFKNDKNTTIKLGEHKFLIEDLSGVWWRRPLGSRQNEELSKLEKYMKSEGEILVRSLHHLVPKINWVSDPNATRLASRKPPQLVLASKMNFRIPETCISNSPGDVSRFISYLQEEKKELTIKPVGSAFIELSDSASPCEEDRVVFTKKIEGIEILNNLDLVKNCPVIFQEAIQKDFDLRVTVIDNTCYAIRIDIEGCKESDNLDWRNYAGKRVYQSYSLPDEVSQFCINFTHSMGLRFGCLDLAFSDKEGYTFFEINPQGQWLPSELKFDYPIADKLIDSLIK